VTVLPYDSNQIGKGAGKVAEQHGHETLPVAASSQAQEKPFWKRNIVRIALVVLALVIVIVVVGVITFLSYRSSRTEPLAVKVYPGARLVVDEAISVGFDHQQYVAADSLENVDAHYDRQKDVNCERQYDYGQDPPQHLFSSCIIDHSWMNMTQYTRVIIQPLVDEAGQPTGEVIIDVQRHWEGG
jgi:hypothetical protein